MILKVNYFNINNDVILGQLTIDNEFPMIFQGRVGQLRVLRPTRHRLPVVRGMRPEHQRGHRHVPVVQKLQQNNNKKSFSFYNFKLYFYSNFEFVNKSKLKFDIVKRS